MDSRVASLISAIRSNPDPRDDKIWWPPNVADTLERLAQGGEIDCVWAALEKRIETAQERHEARLVKDATRLRLPSDDDGWAESLSRTNFEQEAARLADKVSGLLTDNQFLDTATRSERKKLLVTAKASVLQLQNCLRKISYEFDGELHWHMDQHQREFGIQSAELDLREGIPALSDFVRNSTVGLIASQAAVVRPIGYLDTLLQSIEEWAHKAPLVPAANAQNADRLRLIRGLTEYFRERYGTPLRKQVLVVTSCFFDVDTLTEASITKLAP